MAEVDINQFQQTVENQHSGAASFVHSVLVDESFDGEPVWQGAVHVL